MKARIIVLVLVACFVTVSVASAIVAPKQRTQDPVSWHDGRD